MRIDPEDVTPAYWAVKSEVDDLAAPEVSHDGGLTWTALVLADEVPDLTPEDLAKLLKDQPNGTTVDDFTWYTQLVSGELADDPAGVVLPLGRRHVLTRVVDTPKIKAFRSVIDVE